MRVMFEFDPMNYDWTFVTNKFDFRRVVQTTSLYRICQVIFLIILKYFESTD